MANHHRRPTARRKRSHRRFRRCHWPMARIWANPGACTVLFHHRAVERRFGYAAAANHHDRGSNRSRPAYSTRSNPRAAHRDVMSARPWPSERAPP